MSRDLLAREALAHIPKLLTLMDRNPMSPTYGCFDRNHWLYKIIDFPSGMAQEFVYPLALVYALDLPDNPWRGEPAVREWVRAGIGYAARSAHPDGACDDYFPFEKALGAAAFTLLACAESAALADVREPELLAFLRLRADWLADRQEAGRLANHQALAALGLAVTADLLGEDRWERAITERARLLLSWQDEEGWFAEYEGADPGYHSLTLALLCQLRRRRPALGPDLDGPIVRAVDFAAWFMHPDGSHGGEYTSRNTYNFFPHGFELAARLEGFGGRDTALSVNDRFLEGLARGNKAAYEDDHILGHHLWSYLLAWHDFVPERPAQSALPSSSRYFQNARLLVRQQGAARLYVALNKGGAYKLFRGGDLVRSDTGPTLEVAQGGKTRAAVTHLVDAYQAEVEEGRLRVSGSMGWAKASGMTTMKLLVLRLVMLLGGRLHPDLVRRLLQRLLITGKKAAPYSFSRTFEPTAEGWRVTDEVAGLGPEVTRAMLGPDQASIHVVMSRTYQAGQLQPWEDVTDAIRDGRLRVEREP